MLVQLHSVGELRGNVEDGCKPMGGKDRLKQCGVADVALDAGEAGVGVFVCLEIDIYDCVPFAEKSSFEYPSEES